MNKCLFCYKPIDSINTDYHKSCSKSFYDTAIPPQIDLDIKQIKELAIENLAGKVSITGVQPKLSLDNDKKNRGEKRLTIVGLWGKYILKPPFAEYPEIVEIEDLTMHMAAELKIKIAEHCLIRLKSGELAYLTKRFDRKKKERLPVEDMAQLSGTLTEGKYRGSMELIARNLKKYSTYPELDSIRLFELTLFSYLTGNSDMHLKNFSLMTDEDNDVLLTPAYDLLSTKLLLPADKEDLALTLNGKKNSISREDFDIFAKYLKLEKKALEKIYQKFYESIPKLNNWIENSFLSEVMKEKYVNLLSSQVRIIWD